jgi:hypothetical protein
MMVVGHVNGRLVHASFFFTIIMFGFLVFLFSFLAVRGSKPLLSSLVRHLSSLHSAFAFNITVGGQILGTSDILAIPDSPVTTAVSLANAVHALANLDSIVRYQLLRYIVKVSGM